VAAGIEISGKNYFPQLHSLECRINAEDPLNGFRPSPGKITNVHLPGGHGVRVDSHIYSGYTIPPNYDSMIAKLIVSAQSREEALVRMKRALQETVIEGIKTTIPFHIYLMDDPVFKSGKFTTGYLDNFDFSKLKDI
ncbi:MAG: acetyl-CoA carboxylase biotin carboxylase subunit, partial [Cyclobacteriaceae bacterium]